MPRTRTRGRSGLAAGAACLLFLLTSRAPLGAQANATIVVTGSITDSSGGSIDAAAIDILTAGRVYAQATSGRDGRFTVNAPASTPFQLHVRHAGFADQIVNVVGAVASLTHDVTLAIGGLSDSLVVTASGAAEARASVTASTTVMTAPDIQRTGAPSLAEVMRFVPGLVVEGTGRESGRTALFSRGGESDYNLVLVDGVRVNEGGGAFDVSRIAAGEIDRVEVVRGAQSALWGSDAMGAVVQVFTRRANGRRANVSGSLEGGSFGTLRGDASVAGAAGIADYYAGVVRRQTDGAFQDLLREKDRFEHAAFDGSLGVALGSRATVRTGLRYSDADGKTVGNIIYGANDTGTGYLTEDVTWHLAVSHTAGARYTGSGTVNYYRQELQSVDTVADPTFNVYALLEGRPGAIFPDSPRLVRLLTAPEFDALQIGGLGANQFLARTPFGVSDFPSASRTLFRRPAFRYQGNYEWARGQRTTAGYEFERESNPLSVAQRVENNALFVQHQLDLSDRWFVTAGARIDRKASYGTFASPKLSAGGFLVAPSSGALSSLKVFANVGKGIKTPLFSERFGGSFADGNPDLKVERARSADAGVEMTFASQRVRGMVTYFHTQFRDQVEFRSTSPSFSLDGLADFINIAGARAKGLEVEAALQRAVHGVTAAMTYALVDTLVQETVQTGAQFVPGQPLLRRPRHSGSVRLSYGRGPVTVSMNARFIGQRHDSAFLSLRTVSNPNFPQSVTTDITVNPGYSVVGLLLDVRAHRAVSLFIRGDNIVDTVYETALGYPGLPRAGVVGVRVQFGR
jgi:vitamin B12 transporter